MPQYTQQQLDKIIEKLPEELQEAMFSMETAQEIGEICESYGIRDNRVGEISDLAGQVLMGLLLPQEFAQALERDVKLPHVLAQAISRDLNRLVFYPVKPALEQLHQMEIKVEAKVATPRPQAKEKKPAKEGSEERKDSDAYRETIE